MVITNDTPKNTAKDGSRNRPIALTNGRASPGLPDGGVWGRNKLYTPRIADRPAVSRRKPLLWKTGLSGDARTKSKASPAAIQPSVPRTRMPGKSRAPSGTWLKTMELQRARVGL